MNIPPKVFILDGLHPPNLRNSLRVALIIGRENRVGVCVLCRREVAITADEPLPCAFNEGYYGPLCPVCLAELAPALSELLPLEVR